MIEVVVSGAAGRLGARVVARCLDAEGVRLVGALVRPGSAAEGREVDPGRSGGIRYGSDPTGALGPGRVLVEAAPIPAALDHAALAAAVGAPIALATTGFDGPQRRALEGHAARVPVLIAPNLSLGVTVLLDLVATAARALGGYHLEVLELHHARKRDAPSGTAWALARAAEQARGRDVERDAVLARAGETGPRGQHEVGLQSIRGGDVIGEHTVFLIGETERVELSHRAASRDAFAAGAVEAVRFLGQPGRAPGLYTMRDVLGLGPAADARRA